MALRTSIRHFVDTWNIRLLEYDVSQPDFSFNLPLSIEEPAVTLVKIIVITILVILSILLLGRFFI